VLSTGSNFLLDDVSLNVIGHDSLLFNVTRVLPSTFDGFGAFTWAGDLLGIAEFEALNIKAIRTPMDEAPVEELRSLRKLTDRLGILWLDVVWDAPSAFTNNNNLLVDPIGYAKWWVDQMGC